MNNKSQEIKSQDDIKRQDTRSSDVLIKAVEKCGKLEKQLKIAVEALEEVVRTVDEGFTSCCRCGYETDCKDCWCGHDAQNALDKIKELDR